VGVSLDASEDRGGGDVVVVFVVGCTFRISQAVGTGASGTYPNGCRLATACLHYARVPVTKDMTVSHAIKHKDKTIQIAHRMHCNTNIHHVRSTR
jgi:hypothetical protein